MALVACEGPVRADAAFVPHPDSPEKQVEYFAQQPDGSGPWPTIVFLHGHQRGKRLGGRVFADWGVLDRYAREGYLAVSVSLPGYGASDGPPDSAGPHAQHAVKAVLDKLEAEKRAELGRVLLQGVSLGAVTAALLAAGDPEIDGLILISGLYDLHAFLRQPRTPGALAVKAAVVQQTGGGLEALRSRSILHRVSDIKAAALLLNGAKDDRTDPEQAQRLAQMLAAQGGTAKAVVYEQFGHEIPVTARQAEIDVFIARHFRAEEK